MGNDNIINKYCGCNCRNNELNDEFRNDKVNYTQIIITFLLISIVYIDYKKRNDN